VDRGQVRPNGVFGLSLQLSTNILGEQWGLHILLGWPGDTFAQIDFLVSLQLSTYILGGAVVAAHFVGVARGYVRPNGVFGLTLQLLAVAPTHWCRFDVIYRNTSNSINCT